MDVFDPITATSALNTTRMSPAEQKQRAKLITVNTEESYRIWSVWVEIASAQRLMIDSSDCRADRYTVLYYIFIIENVLTPKKFLRKAKVAHLWLFTDSVLQFTVTLFISVDFPLTFTFTDGPTCAPGVFSAHRSSSCYLECRASLWHTVLCNRRVTAP